MTRYLKCCNPTAIPGGGRPHQANVLSEHGTVADAFREADRLAAASRGELWILVTDDERRPVERPAVTVQ